MLSKEKEKSYKGMGQGRSRILEKLEWEERVWEAIHKILFPKCPVSGAEVVYICLFIILLGRREENSS